MPARLRYIVILVTTFVWACNFLASVFVDSYTPSESINGIFMVIVGGLYAIDRKDRDRDDRDRRDRDRRPESEDRGDRGSHDSDSWGRH